MARIKPQPAVTDAGPVIHLDELGCLDLLGGFDPLLTSAIVWDEVRRHRPLLDQSTVPNLHLVASVSSPTPALHRLAQELPLDAGEVSAIQLMGQAPDPIFLTDDAAARFAAETLGHRVHGTIGVVIRAIRCQQRTRAQALDILRKIPTQSSLFIKTRLLAEIVQRVEQETK